MARIKLKLGENEIEVDSRDFYVDNQTLGEIIESITHHLPENQAKISCCGGICHFRSRRFCYVGIQIN